MNILKPSFHKILPQQAHRGAQFFGYDTSYKTHFKQEFI
jgi:hypothetical protein